VLASLLIPLSLAAPLLVANASCKGPNPAITGAELQSRSMSGELNRFVVAVHVTNVGTKGQPSNLLQSVEVMQNGDHVGQKGLPPLRPGQSATVTYAFTRSAGAAMHTTKLLFVLSQGTYAIPGPEDCNAANDRIRLSV
jgi:hypothetical protein